LSSCQGSWLPRPELYRPEGREIVHRTARFLILALLTTAAPAVSACGSPHAAPRIPRSFSSPPTTAERPTTPTPTTTVGAGAVGAAPTDLHDVNLARVSIPGAFCGIPGLVTFTDNEATATSSRWGPVHLSRLPTVAYGNVQGDARSEAAVNVECDNRDGTADGQLAFASIVFAGVQRRLNVIGTVTPQENPPNQHVTLLTMVQLARQRVIAHEAWYRSSDPTCCPSGKAVTVWTLQNGYLSPTAPHIVS
jgi:hypothetical protein